MKAKDKVQVDYTKKVEFTGGKFGGFFSEWFPDRTSAEAFVKNEKSIYYSRIFETEAKSLHSKPLLLANDPKLVGFKRVEGTLETYYETGMEETGLIFCRSDVPPGRPNPKFDSTKPESSGNFKYFKSHESILFIDQGQILELDGDLIMMIKDREFAFADGYRLSFYPQGFSRVIWAELFSSETRKAALWIPATDDQLK